MSGVDEISYVGKDSVVYQLLDDVKELSEYLKAEVIRGRVSLGFIRAIMPFGIDMMDERHAKKPEYYYKTLALLVQELLIENLKIDLRTPWGRYILQDAIPYVSA